MTEEERIKALEDKLLNVVRALIAYTAREKTDSSTRLRMDLYQTGVMHNVTTKKEHSLNQPVGKLRFT